MLSNQEIARRLDEYARKLKDAADLLKQEDNEQSYRLAIEVFEALEQLVDEEF